MADSVVGALGYCVTPLFFYTITEHIKFQSGVDSLILMCRFIFGSRCMSLKIYIYFIRKQHTYVYNFIVKGKNVKTWMYIYY